LAARLHGWLKRSAAGAAWLGTRPLRGLYACHRALAGDQRAIASWSQTMAVLPGLTGAYARRAFYRSVLAEVEDDCLIGFGVLFSHPQTRIGRGVYIGPYAVLGKVTIERDVLIGSQVSITNGAKQHGIERLDVPIREQPGHWPRVTIGEDSWLGDRAIVMASVGRHCVVGAGAVVTKPVPDYAIVVGNPARIVKDRRGDVRGPAEASERPTAGQEATMDNETVPDRSWREAKHCQQP